MKVRYLSGALRDFQQALMWNHENQTGQAATLAKEISAAVNRIKSDPTS